MKLWVIIDINDHVSFLFADVIKWLFQFAIIQLIVCYAIGDGRAGTAAR